MYPLGNNLENYFQTHGLVNLWGIEEIVKLPRDVWYRNAGAVPSLAESLAKTQLIVKGMVETNRTRFQRVMDWPIDSIFMMLAKDNFQQQNPNSDDLIA